MSASNSFWSEIEQAVILSWLESIDERDPEIIQDVLNKCQTDEEAREYFLWRAGK